MISGLIGSQGTIGKSIIEHQRFNHVFNSDNIGNLCQYEFDLVVCAAPSGNRLAVNRQQINDAEAIQQLISCVSQTKIKKFVLISSVDAVTSPDTVYGRNRLALEQAVQQHISDHHILRLSTLIGTHIKKNVLYDLKHSLYTDSIAANAKLQWCILNDLVNKIELAIANRTSQINIVSEPILNSEIIQRFFPAMPGRLQTNPGYYNLEPYTYSKHEIFQAMERYLK